MGGGGGGDIQDSSRSELYLKRRKESLNFRQDNRLPLFFLIY